MLDIDVEENATPFVVVELEDEIFVRVWARATEPEPDEKRRARRVTVMRIIMLTGLAKVDNLQAKL